MLSAFVFFVALAGAKPNSPVKLKTPGQSFLRVYRECGSHLGGDLTFNASEGVVHFRGYRMVVNPVFGGYQLLFAMLKQPGQPVSVSALRGLVKAVHLENFRTLILLFRELDPAFDGFRLAPGRGFYYEPGPYTGDAHPAVNGGGLRVDWLKGQFQHHDGSVRAVNPQVGQLLRLFVELGGRPFTFDEAWDHLFPGRDPVEKSAAFYTMGSLPDKFKSLHLEFDIEPNARVLRITVP